jgi:hypothetical protein
MPLSDPLLLPTADTFLVNKTVPLISSRQGETWLSIAKLHERLALLAQLELPCSIEITCPSLHLRDVTIQNVELSDENLAIVGEGFNLRLRGPNIHSICLVNERAKGASLDIHHAQGKLYASIRPSTDSVGCEVWRDVMDNPSLALA